MSDEKQETENRQPIPDNALYQSMRRGHLKRKGHELAGYIVIDDDGISRLTRTCCAEGKTS